MNNKWAFSAVTLLIFVLNGCQKETLLFEAMDPSDIGMEFSNELGFSKEFNVYTYRNFYNGGGVSLGDVNNDGLLDVYLTANQKPNQLFLNKGDWQFENITDRAGVAGTRAWSTGVSMVDINADGWLDIYVCNSGDVSGDNKQNELFINQKDGTFREEAEAYGLADQGFSTHASFFDFDKDGDLDVYLLNNSYQAIGSFDLRRNERPKRDELGGDKLLENRGGKFIDISEQAGIYGSVIGFGLGVTVGDVNNDGWEDIYVSNDFFERDYLYVNQQNGTFKEVLTESIQSISGASMGADMADVDNDGNADIFVTEMLPGDYERLKSVTTFEDWDKYTYNTKNGYYHQYTRNTLQRNNGDGTFSEIGRMAGVSATDWSWGALLFDMNLDGNKDLFVANGIYKDLTDQDYLQYVSSNEVIESMVSGDGVNYAELVNIIPSNPIANKAFANRGDWKFENDTSLGLDTPGFSNGSAYGDLDNDGDLDLVVNNVNMPLFVYQNKAVDQQKGHFLQFSLKGMGQNTLAVGTQITVHDGNATYSVAQQPVRGFQSSMDTRPHIGLPGAQKVSVDVQWPNGTRTLLKEVAVDQMLVLDMNEGVSYVSTEPNQKPVFAALSSVPEYVHEENNYIDFNKDRLLHHMMSTPGPKLALGDLNGDGFEDLLIPGAKGLPSQVFAGTASGFEPKPWFSFDENKNSETVDVALLDVDSDGDLDVYFGQGGVEFSSFSSELADQLYLNDGRGSFALSKSVLPTQSIYFNTGSVRAGDIDGDGKTDLFVGERCINGAYGVPGSGHLLFSDGKGHFVDKTDTWAPELSQLGMITDAAWTDLDGDGDLDLVVVGEFMGIELFIQENKQLVRQKEHPLAQKKGWWNTVLAQDLNGDGLVDLALGNHGTNSFFKATQERPIRLTYGDFDDNGDLDPIMTFQRPDGKYYPYNLRHNLIDQMKPLKKLFPDYASFKSADIDQILGTQGIEKAQHVAVNDLETAVLMNGGQLQFTSAKLPKAVQISPVYAICAQDFDGDGDLDLAFGGNLFRVKPEVGRYDASYAQWLVQENGQWKLPKPGHGLTIKGEIRSMVTYKNLLIAARNSDSLAIYSFNHE